MKNPLKADTVELITTMLSMLTDLHENFGWDELCDTLENVTNDAQNILGQISAQSSDQVSE